MMNEEQLKQYLSQFPDSCGPASNDEESHVTVAWSAKDIGFGEFVFYYKDGKLRCDNEAMNKDFIKKMLCQMVDDAELDNP